MRSYGSASVTATYSGPLPGTLCYDGSCQQAAPGRYTAPARQVINAWSRSYTESCPSGYRGSVTVTERWQTVKSWTPSEGGLSSRGVLRFGSSTSNELVDVSRRENCVPGSPSDPTANTPGPTDSPGGGSSSSAANPNDPQTPTNSSSTTHLGQRPAPPGPRVTLLPFLPPREGLW